MLKTSWSLVDRSTRAYGVRRVYSAAGAGKARRGKVTGYHKPLPRSEMVACIARLEARG